MALQFIEVFAQPQAWLSLLTLTALEIVLGIDNLVFVALATQGLPPDRQVIASRLGLSLAVVLRLAMLSAMFWLTGLTATLFTAFDMEFSGRDLILGAGGLFLLYKATEEIHEEIDIDDDDDEPVENGGGRKKSFWRAILQIAVLDIVFSIDSVLTAMGMAEHLEVMYLAVIIAVGAMIWAAGPLGTFIRKHPTVRMLALSFLLLIGMSLIAEGFEFHIPRGFIYSAIGFSMMVEALNQWAKRNRIKARAARIAALDEDRRG
jgi:predicted tellurium resistance membrane protein TerC